MRIVFMGTPNFAVKILASLFESKKHTIIGVVTQPDRVRGRGNKVEDSPVKQYCLMNGLEVYQPEKVKSADFLVLLCKLQPDVIVVAAYGQILNEEILNLPKYGCINVHGSLLPKYRGAAPVQYALLNGETESGVTIMQMDKGMDTGAMLCKKAVAVSDNMTAGELFDAIAEVGAQAMLQVLDELNNGMAKAQVQNEDEATYTHLLKREMEVIDWGLSANVIHNKIRAFNPVPGAYTHLSNGKKLKIWRSMVVDGEGEAGKVIVADKQGLVVACGTGALKILEVQPEGKKSMAVKDFVNGHGVMVGDLLK